MPFCGERIWKDGSFQAILYFPGIPRGTDLEGWGQPARRRFSSPFQAIPCFPGRPRNLKDSAMAFTIFLFRSEVYLSASDRFFHLILSRRDRLHRKRLVFFPAPYVRLCRHLYATASPVCFFIFYLSCCAVPIFIKNPFCNKRIRSFIFFSSLYFPILPKHIKDG